MNILTTPPDLLLKQIQNELAPKPLEKKNYSEVFTPIPFLQNHLLHDLPAHVWHEPNYTWLDPAAGTGNFFVAIFYKLVETLTPFFPDLAERQHHILHNMLYAIELNPANVTILKERFPHLHVRQGDALSTISQDTINDNTINDNTLKTWPATFDIIVGNPPFNTELKSTGSLPLYHQFVEHFLDQSRYLSFLIPSKWFSTGKGLDVFRSRMLQRTDLVYIKHFADASTIFGDKNLVSIEGGINYFLKDTEHTGINDHNPTVLFNNSVTPLRTFDVLVDGRYHPLLLKLQQQQHKSLADFYQSQGYYGIETNDKRLYKTNPATYTSSNTNTTTTTVDDIKSKTYVLCYVSQRQGFQNYIDAQTVKNYNTTKNNMSRQVLTPDGNGPWKCFGTNTFVAAAHSVYSKTYVSFHLANERQAAALCAFLGCRLANVLLALRKNSQHLCKSTCLWVPVPQAILAANDKTINCWANDDFVYDYFQLTQEERLLVKNTPLKGYKDGMKI